MPPRFPCSDLPPELLDLIAKHLNTPSDIRNFRSVCRSWRSSTSLPLNLLSLVLPHDLKSPQNCPIRVSSKPRAIIASNTYILEPHHSDSAGNHPKPWMIRVEEFEPGKLRVREPLTHHRPSILPTYFPTNLNLSRFKVLLVSTVYNFSNVVYSRWRGSTQSWYGSFYKLILLYNSSVQYSKPDAAAKAKDIISEALVLCRLGRLYLVHLDKEEKWDPIRAGGVSKFDDLIRIRGRNYMIDRRGRLYSFITCYHKRVSCIVSHPICDYYLTKARKRLAELHGELLVVVRDEYVLRVYKLNEQTRGWDEFYDFGGGKLLFVATDCCFFVDIKNLPGWEENTVVFHKESFPTYRGSFYQDKFLFSPENGGPGLKIGVSKLGADQCCRRPLHDEWHVIWPPPRWLRPPPANSEEQLMVPIRRSICACGEETAVCIMSAFKQIEDLVNKASSSQLLEWGDPSESC